MSQQPFSRSYRLTHYATLVVFVLLAIAALSLMLYVIIIGAVVGAVWLSFHFIKQRFFAKTTYKVNSTASHRIIEHEEQ